MFACVVATIALRCFSAAGVFVPIAVNKLLTRSLTLSGVLSLAAISINSAYTPSGNLEAFAEGQEDRVTT